MAEDVLIGVVRDQTQLEANLKYRFYHIPAGNVSYERSGVRYVALYLSEATFREHGGGVCYIGEVEKAEKLPRGEIRELPSQYPDTLYYKFTVKKWTRLPAPVKLHRKINICDFTDLASLVTTV